MSCSGMPMWLATDAFSCQGGQPLIPPQLFLNTVSIIFVSMSLKFYKIVTLKFTVSKLHLFLTFKFCIFPTPLQLRF